MRLIILGNCLQNTVGLVRSLGEQGNRVILLIEPCKKSDCFIRFSKYVEKIHYLTRMEEAINVLLENYSNENEKSAVFCGSDPTISLLDANYDKLKDHFHIFNANNTQGRINEYLDKNKTFILAEKYGLPLIKTWRITGGESIPDDIIYPCITKGDNSVVSGKWDIHVCNSKEELAECLRDGVTYLVQEFVKKDYEVSMTGISINHGKDIIIPGVIRKVREDLVRMGEFMRLDDCTVYPHIDFDGIKKLIENIGYEGIFSVDMLVKDNIFYFLETNLRNDGLAYIYTAAGANLANLWVKYLKNKITLEQLTNVKINTPFFLMHENDMYNIIEGKVSIWQWMKDFRKSGAFFIMNAKDPMPFIVSTWIHVRQFSKMLLRKVFRMDIQ